MQVGSIKLLSLEGPKQYFCRKVFCVESSSRHTLYEFIFNNTYKANGYNLHVVLKQNTLPLVDMENQSTHKVH